MTEQEILDQLVVEGKITEEDIDSVLGIHMKERVVDELHAQFCTLNHDTDRCEWYEEEALGDEWKRPHHQKWMKLFDNFLVSTNTIIEEKIDL